MIELYQAEWCPFSSAVRERLTELDVPFVARPVPAYHGDRTQLKELAGTQDIPVLVFDDGTFMSGTRQILAELDERGPDPPTAQAHKEQLAAHR